MKDNEYIDKDARQENSGSANQKRATKKKKSAFAMILNGEFLTKGFVLDNLGFIFFLIFLLLILVSKGYYGKQLSKDINQAQREGLRYKLVERLDTTLHENENETKVIRIKKPKTQTDEN
jgi:hypothetical protein